MNTVTATIWLFFYAGLLVTIFGVAVWTVVRQAGRVVDRGQQCQNRSYLYHTHLGSAIRRRVLLIWRWISRQKPCRYCDRWLYRSEQLMREGDLAWCGLLCWVYTENPKWAEPYIMEDGSFNFELWERGGK